MKNLKKIGALVLAVVMIMAMSSMAFAADDTYSGSGHDNAIGVAGGTTIPLYKSIVFFNENGSSVYEPNVTFSYAVAPASIAAAGTDATVTDENNVERNVYPGPTGGVTGTTITFAANATNGTHETVAAGKEFERSNDLTLDISKFTKPGVYRYKITESVTSPAGTSDSTNSDKVQLAGLAARDSAYDETRYLDVYIHYNTDGDLEMYGAVIFKSVDGTAGQSITDETTKTTGFEPGSTTYTSDKTVDKYYTYDFTVKKTVSGSMADKYNEFPFYVAVTNSISGAMFTYTKDGSETFTGATVTDSGAATLTAANFSIGTDEKTSKLTLKAEDTIKLVGVPSSQAANLQVMVKEYNNTYDTYTLTAKASSGGDLDTDPSDGKLVADASGALDATFDLKANDAKGQTITFDNNLTEISPTGVVLRVAPYALLLAGGIFLFILARRKEEPEQA